MDQDWHGRADQIRLAGKGKERLDPTTTTTTTTTHAWKRERPDRSLHIPSPRIRRTMFLSYIKFDYLRILRLSRVVKSSFSEGGRVKGMEANKFLSLSVRSVRPVSRMSSFQTTKRGRKEPENGLEWRKNRQARAEHQECLVLWKWGLISWIPCMWYRQTFI